MAFRLTTLGTASAVPKADRYSSAHLLEVDEHFYLIDCGEGAQLQLRRFRTKFQRINHIFISHLHGDHIFGLPGLLSTLSMFSRTVPMNIYANRDLQKPLMQFLYNFSPDMSFNIQFHGLHTDREELIMDDGKVKVWSFPLNHRIPTCGFRFEGVARQPNISKEAIGLYNIPIAARASIKNGADFVTEDGTVIPNSRLVVPAPRPRSFAYCSDTAPIERLSEYVKGVDLLYHEATFLSTDESMARATFHSTAINAAETAMKAGVGKLVIGHYSARYDKVGILEEEARTLFPNSFAAEDGSVFEV